MTSIEEKSLKLIVDLIVTSMAYGKLEDDDPDEDCCVQEIVDKASFLMECMCGRRPTLGQIEAAIRDKQKEIEG